MAIVCGCSAAWAAGSVAFAGEAALDGKGVMTKVYNRDDGKTAQTRAEMILVDKNNVERKRMFETISKDNGALVNTFIRFTSPEDINNTKFLTIENDQKDNTQYLFLPALGRARKIVGGQKKQSFVNTDFTYEDLERRHPDKDEHKLVKEEKSGSWDCYVVESVPVDKKSSQYSKVVSWVDKASFVPVKVDFYDAKDKNTKRLIVNKLEPIAGIWTATEVVMENIKDNTKTRLKTVETIYNKDVDDKTFTVRFIEEG
jgi:hypothetical protein